MWLSLGSATSGHVCSSLSTLDIWPAGSQIKEEQLKMDAQNDLTAWIASIPKVTKWWFFAFFAVPLTTRLGLIAPTSLVLYTELVLKRFEVSDIKWAGLD